MAEKWQKNDTISVMTEKFNNTIDEMNELKESSTQVNQATTDAISALKTEIEDSISDLQEEVDKKDEGTTAESLGLGNVDNTSDADKPVSTAQKQAIDDATEEMITSEEADLTAESTDDNPELSAPLKAAIKAYIETAMKDVEAEQGVTSYGIATQRNLGVVLSGNDIDVDAETGKVTVPKLAEIKELAETWETTLKQVVAVASQNQSRINSLTKLEEGSTTGDAELIDGRIANNGAVYANIGLAIRSQVQLLTEADTQLGQRIDESNESISRTNADLDEQVKKLAALNTSIDSMSTKVDGIQTDLDTIGDFSEFMYEQDEDTAAKAITKKLSAMSTDISEIKTAIQEIRNYIGITN